jgi:hypothetical protein
MHIITMVNVMFNRFWAGFVTGSDPVNVAFFILFLERLLGKPVTICNTISESEILVESMFGATQLVGIKKWRHSFLFIGESHYCNSPHLYDVVLIGRPTESKQVCLPLFIPYMYCNPKISLTDPTPYVPPKFAITVISNGASGPRLNFIEALEKRARVTHAGRYKNNIGGAITGMYNSPEMFALIRTHKFIITMENSTDSYYLTEKLFNGLASGIVPVYWGCPNVDKYFNTNRFIWMKNIDDASAVDATIDRMLTMSDETYMEMVRQPARIDDSDLLEPALAATRTLLAL